MYRQTSPTEMRQLVLDGFQRHQQRKLVQGDLEQRVRVEAGKVVAYCYRAENLFAMWMVQIGLVQFYDGQGNLLQLLDLTAPETEVRRAA